MGSPVRNLLPIQESVVHILIQKTYTMGADQTVWSVTWLRQARSQDATAGAMSLKVPLPMEAQFATRMLCSLELLTESVYKPIEALHGQNNTFYMTFLTLICF